MVAAKESLHSNATASGNFTVSATPEFVPDANVTFFGGGYDNATNTYRVNEGNLVGHGVGLDFHGVTTVSFGYGNGTYTSVPIATNGLSIDANGTTLTFNNATLQGIVGGDWTDSNGSYNRDIRLTTAAGQNVDTQAIAIRTEAPPTITSHDAGAHYRRDTVVVISSHLAVAEIADSVQMHRVG